jgi:hypothetical protein
MAIGISVDAGVCAAAGVAAEPSMVAIAPSKIHPRLKGMLI